MGFHLSPVMGGKCAHVEACISACQALHQRRVGFCFLAELGIRFSRENAQDGSGSGRGSVLEDEFHAPNNDNNDENGGQNRSIRDPEVYYHTTFTRRILPCPGELQCMRDILTRIEQVPPGEFLALDDRDTVSCHKCGNLNTKPRSPGHRREVALFTLEQGSRKAHV